jgi:hypothetical protein
MSLDDRHSKAVLHKERHRTAVAFVGLDILLKVTGSGPQAQTPDEEIRIPFPLRPTEALVLS